VLVDIKDGHEFTKRINVKRKAEVLEYAKKHPKDSTRQLVEKFSCGRTQIQGILKNKDSLFWRQCTIVKEDL